MLLSWCRKVVLENQCSLLWAFGAICKYINSFLTALLAKGLSFWLCFLTNDFALVTIGLALILNLLSDLHRSRNFCQFVLLVEVFKHLLTVWNQSEGLTCALLWEYVWEEGLQCQEFS